MTIETDKIWEQYIKDNNLPGPFIGEEYYYNNVRYIYNENAVRIEELVDSFPECIHANNCIKIVKNDPPKLTQSVSESARLSLSQVVAANPSSVNILKAMPAIGLDKALETVKATINNTEAKLPAKTSEAFDIITNIAQVIPIIKSDVQGMGSKIFSTITSQLTSDIPTGGTSNQINQAQSDLISELKKLITLANNPAAYAAQHARIAALFPEVDVNKAVLKLANIINDNKAASIDSLIPSLAKLASGITSLLGQSIKHPTKLPTKEQKTPPNKKDKPLIQPKNLFASSAAASSLSTLLGPVKELMSIVSTIQSNVNQIAPSPQTTSSGDQKLTGTANTATWGSGQYEKIETDINTRRILELSYEIETLASEISQTVDLEKITSKTEAELKLIYPQLNESTTVLELYQAILDYENKQL